MSLLQFLRIVWARKGLIVSTTLSCILGAYAVTLIVSPRWDAHSRVLLNLLKADPVTGEIVGGSAPGTYVASQVELIQDYSVTGSVVDRLGLINDGELLATYDARSPSDHQSFRRWLAQRIADHTKADVVAGSNILEITFTGKTADSARVTAQALRDSYLDESLALRRAEGNRTADWFTKQALKAKESLDDAEKAEADYERANNVYMATDTLDVDSARLAMLATQSPTSAQQAASGGSTSGVQLAEINAEIAQEAETLGPNHPQLRALYAKKAKLESIQAQSRAAIATGTRAGPLISALDAQAAIVSSNHDKIAKLYQLHAQVVLRRDLYTKTSARAAELRQQAAVNDVGLTPLGAVTVPPNPSFPNLPLIMLGSFALGSAVGLLVALLAEFLQRKVRGHEDLEWAVEAPLLATIVPARVSTS